MNMRLKHYSSTVYRKNINTSFIGKNALIKNDYNLDIDYALKSINNPELKFTNMIKCKYSDNNAFQFFIEWIDSNHARVNFIDIYHLVFPTPNKERGEKKVNLSKKYEDLKDYSICLSEIKK